MKTKNFSLRHILNRDLPQNNRGNAFKPFGFYWSKKSHSIASVIYSSLAKPNSIICDPFLGSGSSLYGLLGTREKRTFIGVEINEMPIKSIRFNLKQLTISTIHSMQIKFDEFARTISKAYEYPCFKCNNQIHIKDVTLDLNPEYSPKSFDFICPCCGSYEINEKSDKFKEYVDLYLDRQHTYKRHNKRKENQLLTKNSRIAVRKGMYVSDLFSSVNFYALESYKSFFINDESMLTVLSSVLHLCKYTDQKSQSQFPYWYPKSSALDRNILITIRKKLLSLTPRSEDIKECDSLQSAISHPTTSYCLLNKSILDVSDTDIPKESIDLVITDPPYFDQVAYSEYLKLWEYFTGFKSHLSGEIIESQREDSTVTRCDYLKMMQAAFDRIEKMMKNDGILLIYFKDSKIQNMNDFLKIVEKSGFVFEEQAHIDKGKFTYKQNNDPQSTVQGDCLLLFKKLPKNTAVANSARCAPAQSNHNLIVNYVMDYLKQHKKASLGELIDNGLLVMLHRNGVLDKLENDQIVNILNHYFEWSTKERGYVLSSEKSAHHNKLELEPLEK